MFFTPPNQINLFENVAPANIRWFPCVSNHLCPLWRHNCDRTDRINLLPHSQISTLVDCKWIQNTIPVSIFEWQPNIFIQSTNLATYEQRHGKFDNRMALRSHTTSATEIYYFYFFQFYYCDRATVDDMRSQIYEIRNWNYDFYKNRRGKIWMFPQTKRQNIRRYSNLFFISYFCSFCAFALINFRQIAMCYAQQAWLRCKSIL